MTLTTRSTRRWLRLRRQVLRHGPGRVTAGLAAAAGAVAALGSQGALWLAGVALDFRPAWIKSSSRAAAFAMTA